MVIFTVLFAAAAMAVLTVKSPAKPPWGSREYRLDECVAASILLLLATGFAVLAVRG